MLPSTHTLAEVQDRLLSAADALAHQAATQHSAALSATVTEFLAAIAHTYRASERLAKAVRR
jgi:hypothetical protein